MPTGTEGNAGLLGLVGDFFLTKRRLILSDDIGLTRLRSLLLEVATVGRWFSRKFICFNLI